MSASLTEFQASITSVTYDWKGFLHEDPLMLEVILWLLPTAFWVWMLIDCIRNDSDRQSWILVLIFLNVLGALIYFIVRKAPNLNWSIPNFLGRWLRQQEIQNAESTARTIKTPFHYVRLGDLLAEVQLWDRAAAAYQQALDKEPKNLQALWGLAITATQQKHYTQARSYLQTLLSIDPDFKFGDATLAYGRTLLALEDWDQESFLEKIPDHIAHPELHLMFAIVLQQQGDPQAARTQLEKVIDKVRASPTFNYKRNLHLLRKAERLLRTL